MSTQTSDAGQSIKNSTRHKTKRVLLIRLVSNLISSVGHPRNVRVPFLLKYVESLLLRERVYEVEFLDCLANNIDFTSAIETSAKYSPDVIILSSTTLEHSLALKYASQLKSNTKRIVIAVGQDATASPERYIFSGSPIDFVIRGESELSCLRVLKALEFGYDTSGIEGVCSKTYSHSSLAIVSNPDELPFPVYKSEDFNKYMFFYPLRMAKKVIWGHILASRGCPYNCAFCCQIIRESYGKDLRLRKPAKVIDEMALLIEQGANVIAFDDDNFTTSREYAISICGEIKKRKLKVKWTCHARVDNCDYNLLKTLSNSGCILLRFGIESGSERIIRILEKCNNPVGWVKQAKAVFRAAHKIKLPTVAMFQIGNPTETREDIEKSIVLAKELSPDILQICFSNPYPGAALFDRYKDRINQIDIERMYHYKIPLLNFSGIRNEELASFYRRFYSEYLLKPSYIINHLFKYGLFYLYNKSTFFELRNTKKFILK